MCSLFHRYVKTAHTFCRSIFLNKLNCKITFDNFKNDNLKCKVTLKNASGLKNVWKHNNASVRAICVHTAFQRGCLNNSLLQHFYGALIDLWLHYSWVIVYFFTIPWGTIEFYDKYERTARDGEAKLCLAIKPSCLQLFGNFQLEHARTILYSLLSDYRRVDTTAVGRFARTRPDTLLYGFRFWILCARFVCTFSSLLLLVIVIR